MGALSFGLPPDVRADWRKSIVFILTYNLGRIVSYAVAGGIVGGLGATLLLSLEPVNAHQWLKWFAGLIMVGIGLYIGGWFPQFSRIERLGEPLWKKLEPYARRLMPVDSFPKAVVYGVVWGWLPCGLVYTMLMTSATQGDALHGALFMLMFGVGTLPTLLFAGVFAGRVYQWAQRPVFKRVIGIAIILMGVLTLLYQSDLVAGFSDVSCQGLPYDAANC